MTPRIAIIKEDPFFDEEVIGPPPLPKVRCYQAKISLDDGKGEERWTIFIGAGDGFGCSYRKGQAIWVLPFGGTSICLGAAGASSTSDGVNHVIMPPTSESDVLIGAREGGAWQALMLYDTASADILRLKTQVEALASQLEIVTNSLVTTTGTTLPTGSGTLWKTTPVTGFDSLPDADGGVASAGLKSRAGA